MFKISRTGRLMTWVAMLLVVAFLVQCAPPAAAPAAAPVAEQPKAEEPAPAAEPAKAEEPAPAAAMPDNPFAEGCWDFPTEDVTIEIWWHEYGPFTAYVYELIDRYQALHPNVTINPVVASQTDMNQKLTVAIASGTGPDILDQDISFFSAYYEKGALEPIDIGVFCADTQDEIEAEYVPSVMPGVKFDGAIYGLPYQTNSMSFFLNTEIFKEAGLDPVADAPKTWEQLKEIGAKLKVVENGQTVRKGYDFPYQSQRWLLQEFQPMLQQFGGDILNEDQSACTLNSEAAVNALTLWTEVSEAAGDPNVSVNTPSQPNQDFIDGRVAIWMTGPWATNQINESQLGSNWAVTGLPQLDPENPVTMMYGFTWGVNKAKPEINKKVAWDFVRYMLMQPEEWLAKASFIQPRAGLADGESAKAFPYIDVHLGDVETARWYLRHPKTNEIVQIVGKAIERVIFQGMAPQESLDTAQTECNKTLAD